MMSEPPQHQIPIKVQEPKSSRNRVKIPVKYSGDVSERQLLLQVMQALGVQVMVHKVTGNLYKCPYHVWVYHSLSQQ